MSAIEATRIVEADAWVRLRPFIQEHSNGQFVLIEKSPLARALQETVGDILFNHRKMGRLVSVEVKAEKNHTGNLFLETWSNLNVSDEGSFEERGCNPGWLLKLHPTLLFYYFIDTDRLYIFRFHRLARWAFETRSKCNPEGASRLFDFRETAQSKYAQRNKTVGHIVPLSVLREEVGYQLINPSQLSLFPDDEAA